MTRFGRFLLLLFVVGLSSLSGAAQDDPAPYRLLVARTDAEANQTTVSRFDIDTHTVEEVITLPSAAVTFSLSPLGDRLAYGIVVDSEEAGDGDLETGTSAYILDLDSGESMLMAENVYLSPIWSPDGERAVIMQQDKTDPDKRDLVIAEGDTIRTLQPDRSPASDLLWSLDGTLLIYISEAPNHNPAANVYFVVRTDGTDQGHILLPRNDQEAAYGYSYRGWIPGTHDLLLSRGGIYEVAPNDLMRMNVDTGTLQTLIASDGTPHSYGLHILDDGRIFIAIGSASDDSFLHWLNPDTGELTPTTIHGALLAEWSDTVLTFSPHQTKAAYSTYNPNSKVFSVGVSDLETSHELATIPVTTDIMRDFIWSPDGQQIAVATVALMPSGDYEVNAIYVVNADGSGTPQRIAQDVGTTLIGWY